MPYNSSEEFDIIKLVEFDTFQTPQPKNITQNHLHRGHHVPPNPWEKNGSQKVWHPRCLHNQIALIVCILCLFYLKKDLFVIIKGYMCNYDFMQGTFCSYFWIGCAIIAFVEGAFAKFSAFIAWQESLQFSPSLKWNFIEKTKFIEFKITFMFLKLVLESLIK